MAGGYLIDVPTYFQIYYPQVKHISVKLIEVISTMVGLNFFGDVSNAYINADTSHKVYIPVAGTKFGSLAGQMNVIKRALYGLSTSGADWYCHFLTILRFIGFTPTRFDRDFWIKLDNYGDHY